MSNLALFAQDMYNYENGSASQTSPIFSIIGLLIGLAIAVVVIVGLWKTFTKAGKPGWAAIIPFYNVYILAQIGGRPGSFGLIAALVNLVPFVGWIASAVMILFISLDVAKAFGRSQVFGIVGLWLFSPIGYLILGFGKDTYHGPQAPVVPTSQSGPTFTNPTTTPLV